MAQQMHNNPGWRHTMLPTMLGLLLSVFVLHACSSDLSGIHAHGTSLEAPALSSISLTWQNAGEAELATFQQWIALMQQHGGKVTTYQRQYTDDQQALSHASSDEVYSAALKALQAHTRALELPAMRQQCVFLQQQLQQQVSVWGGQHTFHDTYNNITYKLGYEYDNVSGIGGPDWLQGEMSSARTLADYQQTVEDLSMWLSNFQAMKANFADKTPANQAHRVDLDLLRHYGDMNTRVVVVTLSEQEMRVYDHGKLINAFPVTTGQPDLPSLPGTWQVEGEQHPTIFKSSEPQGSPDWYPDTPINYAMQYHSNGYFLHDAWWRTEFGPGTNFPHHDPDGDPFAGQGSHGCINLSTQNAAWLYGFVSVHTPVVVY